MQAGITRRPRKKIVEPALLLRRRDLDVDRVARCAAEVGEGNRREGEVGIDVRHVAHAPREEA